MTDDSETDQRSDTAVPTDDGTQSAQTDGEVPLPELVEMATEPLYSVDCGGRFEVVNDAFVSLAGYDPADLVGETAVSFIHEDDREEWRRRRQLLTSDETVESEQWIGRLCSKTGTDIPVEWQFRLVRDGASMIGRARDIREGRHKEQKLNVLNRALRHNIRNQMNLIINKAVTLQEIEDEWYQTTAAQIEDLGEDIVSISDKARKAQEHIGIVPDAECEKDLSSVTETVLLKFSIRFPNATVESELPEQAPARAPPSVGTAIMELLENAVVHHPSGSGPVQIRVKIEGDTTHIRVFDECDPIPDSIVETLSQGAEQPLQHNLGIGLWLVRWVLDTVDGGLSFDRRSDGTGNVVTMSFETIS